MMQRGRAFNRQQLFIVVCMSMLLAPVWAQVTQETKIKPEMILNNISLDTSFVEVLTRRGVPHYIGPSVSGLSTITSLLRSPEQRGTVAGPAAPINPNAPGYRAPAPAPYGGYAGAAQVPMEPKKEKIYMVWRYDGKGKTPDPEAPFTMYVFINDQGNVEAVVVNLNNPESVLNIQTETEITFGTRLSDIVKIYNWPEPFTRVGNMYYCSYPEYRVTFGLDAVTRKVTCISIGVPFVVTAQSLDAGQAAQAGIAPGRSGIVVPQGIGGMPGSLPPLERPPGGYMGGMEGDVPSSRFPGAGGFPPGYMQQPPPPPPG